MQKFAGIYARSHIGLIAMYTWLLATNVMSAKLYGRFRNCHGIGSHDTPADQSKKFISFSHFYATHEMRNRHILSRMCVNMNNQKWFARNLVSPLYDINKKQDAWRLYQNSDLYGSWYKWTFLTIRDGQSRHFRPLRNRNYWLGGVASRVRIVDTCMMKSLGMQSCGKNFPSPDWIWVADCI